MARNKLTFKTNPKPERRKAMGGIFKTPQEEYEEGVEIGKQLDIVGQELHEIPF